MLVQGGEEAGEPCAGHSPTGAPAFFHPPDPAPAKHLQRPGGVRRVLPIFNREGATQEQWLLYYILLSKRDIKFLSKRPLCERTLLLSQLTSIFYRIALTFLLLYLGYKQSQKRNKCLSAFFCPSLSMGLLY